MHAPIVIVGEDPIARERLRAELEADGHRVVEVVDLAQALALAGTDSPAKIAFATEGRLDQLATAFAEIAERSWVQGATLTALEMLGEPLALDGDLDAGLAHRLRACLAAIGLDLRVLHVARPEGAWAPAPEPDLAPLCARACAMRTPLALPSDEVPPEVAVPILSRVDAASALVVPLVVEGDCIAVAWITARHGDLPRAHWRDLAWIVCGRAAQMVQLARSFRALAKAETRSRLLMELASDGVVITDGAGTMIGVNKPALARVGLPEHEVLGRSVLDLVDPVDVARAFAGFRELSQTGRLRLDGVGVRRADGTMAPVDLSASAVRTGDGASVLLLLRDATRRMAEVEANARRARRHALVAGFGRGALVAIDLAVLEASTLEAVRLELGAACCLLVDLAPDGSPGAVRGAGVGDPREVAHHLVPLLHAARDAAAPRLVRELVAEGLATADLGYRSAIAAAIEDAHPCVLVALRDDAVPLDADDAGFVHTVAMLVTEARRRARADEVRLKQAAILEQIFASISDGVLLADPGGRFVAWNRATIELLGFPAGPDGVDAWMARHTLHLPGEEGPRSVDALPLGRALRGEHPEPTDVLVRRTDGGGEVLLSVMARPALDARGRSLGAVGVFRDVGAERAREAGELRRREDLRRILELSPDGIAVTRDTQLVYVNLRFARMLGHDGPAALLGRRVTELVAPDAPGLRADVAADPADAHSQATRMLRRDGVSFPVEVKASLLPEFEGAPAQLIVARDVTERAALQDQLLLAERMASIGVLAAGVAHEVNNPLAAILANLDLASASVATLAGTDGASATVAELGEQLADVRVAAERVREITRDLRLFGRAEEDTRGRVDLTRTIATTLRLARNEVRHRARLITDFRPVPDVLANESRLGQVILNLVVNAAQAIREGASDVNEIRVVTRTDPRGDAVVEVSDTGPGIAPAVRAKLFSPFFTTKPAGEGTGLGLAICRRIVESFGGSIAVESEVGRGATFRIVLPAARATDLPSPLLAPAPPAPAPAPPAPAPGPPAPAPGPSGAPSRRGRILVVDDEPIVGQAVRRTLARAHEVVVVTSGADALALLRAGERYDLILCDLMMPLMTGMELYGELGRLDPTLCARVIFLTGGAFTTHARAFLDENRNELIEKPFDVAALRECVDARLARP